MGKRSVFNETFGSYIKKPSLPSLSEMKADGSMASFLKLLASLTFLASMVGIPLSIVSMFSKEKLSKRIFALVVHVVPISLILFGLLMEIMDEFNSTIP